MWEAFSFKRSLTIKKIGALAIGVALVLQPIIVAHADDTVASSGGDTVEVTDTGTAVSESGSPASGSDSGAAGQEGGSAQITDEESQNIAAEGGNGENGSAPAASSSSTTQISTGDASATANVTNVANTNVTNSSGTVLMVNQGASSQDIDTRTGTASSSQTTGSSTCATADTCTTLESLAAANTNSATTTNNLDVRASSGENTIQNTSGENQITTGDAFAAANVLNVINTNILGSEYLLLIVNNFGDFGGDVILPGKDFFSYLLDSMTCGSCGSGGDTSVANTLSVTNDNQAGVTNNGTASANTGNNTIDDGVEGSIVTGTAVTRTNIGNLVNTNVTNDDSVYILIRVSGDWTGEMFSLPDGLSWERTSDGVLVFATPTGSTPAVACDDTCVHNSTSTITNANTATVLNNVNVSADTGNNHILNSEGSGQITTGNATAVANIFNVVNTNIVGRNWLMALINIFGDWHGNLAFGRPDLWVGQRAEVSTTPLSAGAEISFVMDVMNRGDADATNVKVKNIFNHPEWITVIGGSGTWSGGGIGWTIDRLTPGERRSLTFTVRLGGPLAPGGGNALASTAQISGFETDANLADNSDALSFVNIQGPPAGGSPSYSASAASGIGAVLGAFSGSNGGEKLTLTKTNDSSSSLVTPGSTVKYQIQLKNSGTAIANAVLEDALYDPYGRVIARNRWPLETIGAGEKIDLNYDVKFRSDAEDGWYLNVATVTGEDAGGSAIKKRARSAVYVVNPAHYHHSGLSFYQYFPPRSTSIGTSLLTRTKPATAPPARANRNHASSTVTSALEKPRTPDVPVAMLASIEPVGGQPVLSPEAQKIVTSNKGEFVGSLAALWLLLSGWAVTRTKIF